MTLGAEDTTPVGTRDLLISIREKQERMGVDIKEIKDSVSDLSECYQEFQINYTKEHELVLNDTKRAHMRIDEFLMWKIETEKKISAMEKLWERQNVMNAIMAFVATVLGGAVLSYIWSLIVK